MYLGEIEKSIKQPCALWHRQHFSNPDAPQIGITVTLRTMGGPGSGVPDFRKPDSSWERSLIELSFEQWFLPQNVITAVLF